MSSPSDGARRAAGSHRWVACPEAGEGAEICDACGARPGTPEADGPCDEPRGRAYPEPWDFWPGGIFGDIMPGTGGKKP
jgi:hypothetical protein